MRRKPRVLLALTYPALLGVACLPPTFGADRFEDPCTSYDRGPLARPSSATLLTDTLDVRSDPDTLFVALEGYTPEFDYYTLTLVAIDPALPRGWGTIGAVLFPIDSSADIYYAASGSCASGGDSLGCPTTGVYRVDHFVVERPGGMCVVSGEYLDVVFLTASQLGMADSVFVVLGKDPPVF